MTDKELQYITVIAETNSITKAAEKLFIAQPSLTQMVQRLETELNVLLFHRTNTGLQLTDAGKQYVRAAIKIQKLYRDMELEIGGISNMLNGKIRIGITSYLGTMLLPQVIPIYKEKYPNIEIEFIEGNSTALEQMTASGRVDLAVMHKPIVTKNINLETIITDYFLLALDENNKWVKKIKKPKNDYPTATTEMLNDLSLIMVRNDQRIGQISNHILALSKAKANIVYTTRNFDTARSMAAVGLGATFVPESYTKFFTSVKEPYYFKLPLEWGGYWDLCIAYPKNSNVSKPCLEFFNILKQYVLDNREVF